MKNDLIRDAILQDIVDHKDVSIAEVAERLEDIASYMIIRRNILALVEEGKLLQQGKIEAHAGIYEAWALFCRTIFLSILC